jgi:hypothetical protein
MTGVSVQRWASVWCGVRGKGEQKNAFLLSVRSTFIFANVCKNHIETHTKNDLSSLRSLWTFRLPFFPISSSLYSLGRKKEERRRKEVLNVGTKQNHALSASSLASLVP